MTTERMTDEEARTADKAITAAGWVSSNGVGAKIRADWLRARRVEQEQAEKIRKLEEMLRLTSDKMAEQVRQARHEVACDAIATSGWHEMARLLVAIRDANAPKG